MHLAGVARGAIIKMQDEIRIGVTEASIHQKTPIEESKLDMITENKWLFCALAVDFSHMLRRMLRYISELIGSKIFLRQMSQAEIMEDVMQIIYASLQ